MTSFSSESLLVLERLDSETERTDQHQFQESTVNTKVNPKGGSEAIETGIPAIQTVPCIQIVKIRSKGNRRGPQLPP
jgi:hypothetical protein